MPQNEEPSTQNHDWDDADPDIKQRFQELAREDTEHRTKFDEARFLADATNHMMKEHLLNQGGMCAMSPKKAVYRDNSGSESPDTTIYHDIQDPRTLLEYETSLHEALCAISDALYREEEYNND